MEQPAGPQKTLAYRGAKFAVIVLSALIILALIGLVVGTVMKLSGRSTHLIGRGGTSAFALPPGAKIVSAESQPGRLILHVRSPQGDEIDIIDTDDGRLISQVKTPPPTPPSPQ
jgi:hypothetical protein